MGGSSSRAAPADTLIGVGTTGSVYLCSDGCVLKRGKHRSLFFNEENTIGRELRANDWIESIPKERDMQKFFALIMRFHIFRDLSYMDLPERRNWPYTYEIVMENKGRKIDRAKVTTKTLLKAMVQAFQIVQFLKEQEAAYIDWHLGNILIQPSGDIALVDYGDLYFKGDAPYAETLTEHTMIMQIVGMLTDIQNTIDLEDTQAADTKTSNIERIHGAMAIPQVRETLIAVAERIGYANPIDRALADDEHRGLFAEALLLDTAKLRFPAEFKRFMGFKDDAILHSWVGWDSVSFIYNNLLDISLIIAHFTEKLSEIK